VQCLPGLLLFKSTGSGICTVTPLPHSPHASRRHAVRLHRHHSGHYRNKRSGAKRAGTGLLHRTGAFRFQRQVGTHSFFSVKYLKKVDKFPAHAAAAHQHAIAVGLQVKGYIVGAGRCFYPFGAPALVAVVLPAIRHHSPTDRALLKNKPVIKQHDYLTC
jgi:hypothetical protein